MGMQAFQPLYGPHASFSLLVLVLALTAVAGSFIKPSVLGTVAVTTTPESKSMGYAVYYWIVNMGGAVGPVLANLVRNSVGIQFVYVTSALSCLAMLVVNVLFYREVQGDAPAERESLQSKVANLFLVLKNARFMLFLLIFSLFWAMYWQIWVVVPCYLVDFVSSKADYDLISSAGAWSIIILQLGVNYVTRGPPAARCSGARVRHLGLLLADDRHEPDGSRLRGRHRGAGHWRDDPGAPATTSTSPNWRPRASRGCSRGTRSCPLPSAPSPAGPRERGSTSDWPRKVATPLPCG